MYSEKEKVFYVERMWAEGLRPATAQRLWGRPSRESLSAWERAALAGELPAERPRVPGACGHERHARYPRETRDEALRLVSLGKTPGQAARALGLPSGRVVQGWLREERRRATIPAGGRAQGAPRAKGGGVGAGDEVEALRARVAELEGLLEVYKAVVLDPKAAGLASRPSRWKVAFGERLRRDFGLALSQVLPILGMSKSTYEYNRRRILDGAPERGGDADIEAAVAEVFEVAGGGARGYRFVWAELRRRGLRCSEKRVRRVMRALGLVPRCRRRARRYSSYAGETDGGAPNLLLDGRGRHVFRADAPMRLWLTDVTEFSIPAGRLYLSPILDCHLGAVVAWSVSGSPDSALAGSMLRAGLSLLPPGAEGPLLHTDRGALYRSGSWKSACEAAGVTRSMSRLGRSPDNARMEGFFGTMKNEMFHGRDWSLAGLGDLRGAIDGYMASYNTDRLRGFREDGPGPRGGRRGRLVYDTIDGRTRALGFEPVAAVNATPVEA